MSLETITFHKRTFFPSSSNAFISNVFNPNQIYFASGSKLVLYDFTLSKKIFRINTKGSKILYLQQNLTDQDKMFILDLDNNLYQFKMSTKEVLCIYQLPKDKKYSLFEIVNNRFIYCLSEEELLLTKIKIAINGQGDDTLEKMNEHQIHLPLLQQKNKNANNNQKKIKLSSNFIIINDSLIFSVDNQLIIYNLLTNESENIRFQKKITKINKINDDSICIGDSAGKIYFIQDITSKNYILYTKHWHSHGVTDLQLDPNNDYLYSCGQEGVVVIWNIHTWVKSFLPRLGEPILRMAVSNDSQNLICYLKNSSIVFISLNHMKIIDVINSVSNDCFINRFSLFNKKQNYITFTNAKRGIINLYNISSNTFDFYLNVFNKNFNSKTEREKDNNLRVLKLISFSSPKNTKNLCYMMTIEELPYDIEKKLFLSYMKIWKFEKDSIDLMQICENPHDNESITFIEGLNFNNYGFLTKSEKYFKIWKLNEKNNKFTCSFEGKYQNRNLLCVNYDNNLVDEYIFAMFENKLITYNQNKIKDIYSFDTEYKYTNIYYINSQNLCLYGKKNLALFDIAENEVILEENLSKENSNNYIIKVAYLKNEDCLNVFIGVEDKKDLFYIIKYNISNANSSHKMNVEKCFVVEKKNYEYVDWFKKYLVIINNRKEFYIANEYESKSRKNTITKKEMDDKDIEL